MLIRLGNCSDSPHGNTRTLWWWWWLEIEESGYAVKHLIVVANDNMSNYKDSGEKSDESTSNVEASFSCETCGEKFSSRQELKEHSH
ncbi:MAG: hypothetical protein WA364_03140 [Candidatus Nitrosopolaris sp.]